mmetsp:Transcript_47318/g.53647  ORF Transcript_47318/g.53647 Transcript_47318/m.53647 type:complete len:346 (+) Transcript_47318:55-1092(+)
MPSTCTRLIALLLFLFLYLFPIVSSLSTAALVPSNQNQNDKQNVIRSYTFADGNICCELLSPSSILDQQGEDEDEVEYWYPTKRRHFEFSISPICNSPITIRQTSFGCGKLGGDVWDSSIALCLYLGKQCIVKGSRVLELGSGCGLPSVVCRDVLQASAVLATDFWETDNDVFDEDRLVPTKFHGMNLKYNVDKIYSQERQRVISDNNGNDNNDDNRVVETAVLKMDWHDRVSTKIAKATFCPDLVIGSDLVYYPMDVEPLLNTLEVLLDGNKESPSPTENKNTRAVLVLPLAPSEREALPEFRKKIPARFSTTHEVKINEIDLFHDQDKSGEKSTFLTVDIIPK